MQSLIRSKSAGVTGGRGTAGAGPGRDLLYSPSVSLPTCRHTCSRVATFGVLTLVSLPGKLVV